MRRLAPFLPPVLVALFVAAVLFGGGGSGGYTLTAAFANASLLQAGFNVKRDGVPVGEITNVRLSKGDAALVTFRLNRGAYPIGSGAQFLIQSSNLLGERYVGIENPVAGRPLASGSLISEAHTGTPPELNDVIDMLNPPTRVALGIVLEETGAAFVGRSTNLATILRQLPPSLDQAQETVSDLDADNSALEQTLDKTDQILAAVTPQRRSLGRLIDTADGAFTALAGRERDLSQTIRLAGPAVQQVTRSLVRVSDAVRPIGAAASGLRATAAPLTSALLATPRFVAQADPTLLRAGALAPELTQLLNIADPVVSHLLPTTKVLLTTAQDLDPVTAALEQSAPDTLAAIQDLGRSGQNRDSAGHYLLGVTTTGSDATSLLEQLLAGNTSNLPVLTPSAPKPSRSATEDEPVRRQPGVVPSAPTVVAAVNGVSSSVAPTVNGISSSLKSLLGYLTGK